MKTARVTIEKIYEAREGKNQDFMTLQLRQEREKPKTLGNLRNLMLSANTSKTAPVVAFETMHKTAIETLGLEEGQDLGKALGQEVTLKITELTEEEYLALPNPAKNSPRVGFQFKVNNGDEKKILVKNGAPVFRKVSIDIEGAEDKLVQHDGMVDPDEFDIEDYRGIEADETAPNLVA